MDEKLLRFFKKINFNDVESFDECKLKECSINKKDNTWTLKIESPNLVNVNSVIKLINLCRDGIDSVDHIYIQMIYESLNPNDVLEYYIYFFNQEKKHDKSLNVVDVDNIKINDNTFIVETLSSIESKIVNKVSRNILDNMSKLGIRGYKVETTINEVEKKRIQEEIEREKASVQAPVYQPYTGEEEHKWVPKKKIDYKREGIVSISSIKKDENSCNIDAYVFGSEFTTLISKKDNKEVYMMSLKVSDNTSSIMVKRFASDTEEFATLQKTFKDGKWFHFVGDVRYDERYAKDYIFNLRTYEEIDSPVVKRKDEEEVKRVELHAHTMMSQMDGVIDENVLVKQAISWGMPGIGIMDHDGCQAFPHVFEAVTKYNKNKKKEFSSKIKENEASLEEIKASGNEEGIKELEKFIEDLKEEQKNFKPFKAAYGTELDMCESNLDVCFNPNDSLIKDNTFVVFDTETTGFNPGLGDSMIELGAVKIKNGEVIDRFDELINPGHHIDEAITKVTNITDADVSSADNEENVTKRFKEWIENLPLVAHNARFDKNMLDMAYYKYKLGKLENPIIDTLMLSRVINRDLKRHSLAALGKFYGIDTGESDDEESTSEVSSSDIKLDEEQNKEIEDVLVDGESIIKKVEVEYQEKDISNEQMITKKRYDKYLTTIYKASKTESVNVTIKLNENLNLIDFEPTYKLHAAENALEFKYMTPFGEKKITFSVYVGSHHGADVDAENTGYIFSKMLHQIEGVTKLNDLNDLGLLEYTSYANDSKLLSHIGDTCSYKNYIRLSKEDETKDVTDKLGYPFARFNNFDYVWKYPWCHEDNLQMYENIPGKTYTEHLANVYDRTKHVTFIAKNHDGLKNLFKIISFANTNYMQRNARIPRKLIEEYREGILVGSACLNGDIFYLAETRNEEELKEAMKFYDFIEIQPIENYEFLLRSHDIDSMDHLKKCLKKIIKCATEIGKLIIATGDVHILNKEDNIYREIIVNQNIPGKGRHTLARYLHGYAHSNNNKENIEDAINKAKRNGIELSKVDIKVLKYIYALKSVNDIPITSSNLTSVYVPNKSDAEETQLCGKEEDKRMSIDASLRKLQIGGIISFDYSESTYSLNTKYNPSNNVEEGNIPAQYFLTTKEMLEAFKWLKDPDLVHKLVIDNPLSILDSLDEIEVIVYPLKPFSPIIPNSQETCRDLVFTKAQSMYGNPLPRNIEERIAEEFYGGKIFDLVNDYIDETSPGLSDEEKDKVFSSKMHEVIMSGYDGVVNLMTKHLQKEDPELDEETAMKNAKDGLSGIIGGGFDVIYLIAQKLVKHSNDRGYLVGSRGSVGSSFVAAMMGITECNSLPPHYYCPSCHYSMFHEDDGKKFSFIDPVTKEDTVYLSGFDLPERVCPKCGADMIHEGNDMPFATFLGFQGEKVPDIDLNFSGDDQPFAHEYTKDLFGTDNVYRAGTIATVADKTAYGYVQGFFEEKEYDKLRLECQSYGLDLTGKDDLKKKKVIVCNVRSIEVERIAIGCTGVKRTTGQHPGGIVVVPGYKDVWDFTPFQYPADDPTAAWRTTHFDYHKIEADLLKLDILGHDNPTILRMLQDLSGIDVTKIDLGDRDTMKIFTGPEVLGLKPEQLRGLKRKDGTKYCPTGTLGIPEFGTAFLLGMLEETKPSTFAELIKISGLSHGTDVWLGNAQELIHNHVVPFSKVIGCRDDIMVNLIAWGIPAGKAFTIMEFVRKGRPTKAKKPDDPETWKEYKKYMKENGIPDYYIDSCQKIQYMFPKAHATAYVTSAFRIAWFKVHDPILFYCAYLSIRKCQFDIPVMVQGENAIRARIDEIDEMPKPANKDIDTRDTLLICLEMCCRGFYFKNIDIELSDSSNFVITDDRKGLVIPFKAIDGFGDAGAIAICKNRKTSPFISQEDLRVRGKCPQSAIDKLKELGCLDNLPESNQLSLF
ncbi:MAG TPA: PolC-type DNA polymerase III [Bacilli bacterium]|nr:PolC-type DNA polymerase III [Bacilli bacterium]